MRLARRPRPRARAGRRRPGPRSSSSASGSLSPSQTNSDPPRASFAASSGLEGAGRAGGRQRCSGRSRRSSRAPGGDASGCCVHACGVAPAARLPPAPRALACVELGQLGSKRGRNASCGATRPAISASCFQSRDADVDRGLEAIGDLLARRGRRSCACRAGSKACRRCRSRRRPARLLDLLAVLALAVLVIGDARRPRTAPRPAPRPGRRSARRSSSEPMSVSSTDVVEQRRGDHLVAEAGVVEQARDRLGMGDVGRPVVLAALARVGVGGELVGPATSSEWRRRSRVAPTFVIASAIIGRLLRNRDSATSDSDRRSSLLRHPRSRARHQPVGRDPASAPGREAEAAREVPSRQRRRDLDPAQWRDRAHGERRYEARRRLSGTESWTTETLKRNSTSFTAARPRARDVLDFQLRACGRRACSKWSAIRTQATLLAAFNGPHPDPGCEVLPAPTRSTRMSPACRRPRTPTRTCPRSTPTAATCCTPTSARTPTTGSRTRWCRQPAAGPDRVHQYGDESDPGPYPVPPRRADRGRLQRPRAGRRAV